MTASSRSSGVPSIPAERTRRASGRVSTAVGLYGGAVLRIGSIVWGVRDVPRAIRFWCEALDYRPLREPDVDWAILVPRVGEGPQLAIKLVTSERPRRHHLDLYASDQAAEVERLVAIGASRPAWNYEDDADYVVLADPDGNTFCVVDAGDKFQHLP